MTSRTFWISYSFCNLPYKIVAKKCANIDSTNDQNWSWQAFGFLWKASVDSEKHEDKVKKDKKNTEAEPFRIQTMTAVGQRMLYEYWNILEETTFQSSIVVAVNSNVEDSSKIKYTKDEVKYRCINCRKYFSEISSSTDNNIRRGFF